MLFLKKTAVKEVKGTLDSGRQKFIQKYRIYIQNSGRQKFFIYYDDWGKLYKLRIYLGL